MLPTISSNPSVLPRLLIPSAPLHTIARADAADDPVRAGQLVRTLRMPRGAPISVLATVGDVTVVGWDRPDVEITMVRSAPAQDALSEISAAIESDSNGLRVTAVQPGGKMDARLRGSVTIHAPVDQPIGSLDLFEGTISLQNMRAGVRAAVEHGSIAAMSLGGPVRLQTGIGDIHIDNVVLADNGMLRLRTFNGNVTLAFAATPAHARILALSMAGAIRSDIPLSLKTGFGPRFGDASIGRGGPVISIDVVSGDIRISIATS